MSSRRFFLKSRLRRSPLQLFQHFAEFYAGDPEDDEKMIEQICTFRNNTLPVAGDSGNDGFHCLFPQLLAGLANTLGIKAGSLRFGVC
jgi:hypothetical protein